MRTYWFYFSALIFFFSACSNKYAKLSNNYQFKSGTGQPDYSDLNYWAAHPWKWDPSDSIPAPLKNEKRDTTVDVFFLHPTTFTKGKNKGNAIIDDALINAKTDYTSILYQASVFNQHARVFSPRYRQAHIRNFFEKDTALAKRNFDLAYEDLRSAFLYYLKYWNKGRPFILASHSQGSLMAVRLYKEFIEGKPLEKQMIAGYFIGWPILKSMVAGQKICQTPGQINCLCSWRTLKNGFIPFYLKDHKENLDAWVTNPISWMTTQEYASRKNNKGSVLLNFNKVYSKTTDARISNGVLFVKKPRFPWSFLYFKRNYHVADINLFYMDLRINTEQRIQSYFNR